MDRRQKVLVVGASGMLGNAMLRFFAQSSDFVVKGTIRADESRAQFPDSIRDHLVSVGDVLDGDRLPRLVEESNPDVIINCIGLVKQFAEAKDPLLAIPINALFPHRLARMATASGSRLIHFSTDCVFSGRHGMYTEDSFPDCDDLYGRSKLLGEVDDGASVTLRTSIIGHELQGAHGLLNWFLAQTGRTQGYVRAIFSGLPTVEVARVVRDYVLPRQTLRGTYHLSGDPISKYDLLLLIAEIYGKTIEIEKDDRIRIDRSLDSSRFRSETAYTPPAWRSLVQTMRDFG